MSFLPVSGAGILYLFKITRPPLPSHNALDRRVWKDPKVVVLENITLGSIEFTHSLFVMNI